MGLDNAIIMIIFILSLNQIKCKVTSRAWHILPHQLLRMLEIGTKTATSPWCRSGWPSSSTDMDCFVHLRSGQNIVYCEEII